ncbi:MAG TPA: DUF1707 domain-containing protein [Streptosporangiaceae bacterium]|nr:DUF1707 domain-containing protein [Streptosporangiaceae bacterium]
MNEHIRISDADRERVVERLREHYAEGRLTSDEHDERVTAALNAKTYGDLRALMTDLPEPETVGAPGAAGPTGTPGPDGPSGWQYPPWFAGGRPIVAYRRGPRILPLVLIALAAAIAFPAVGWVAFAFLKLALLFFLVMALTGIIAGHRFRRNVRRYRQSGANSPWHQHDWRR